MEKNRWLGLGLSVMMLIGFGSLFFQYQPVPYVTDMINEFVLTHPWTDIFYRILIAIIFIGAIVGTASYSRQFLPSKKLRLSTMEGTIEINQKDISSIITGAITPILATEKVQMKVKVTEKNRLFVKVNGVVQNEDFYPYLKEDLQIAISNALKKTFALQNEKIKVVLFTGFNQARLLPVEPSL